MAPRLIFVVLLFFISSCSTIPEEVLDKDKVANLYTELFIAESLAEKFASDSNIVHIRDSVRGQIFKFYKTDSLALSKSIDYYSQNDEDIRWIFKTVGEQLDSIQYLGN